ncbi:hypothetical protein IWW50_003243 [Coemansia erecta]|nr:hypothetical protein GGF43_002639 [Coemansia sp. RSA 2618]KAJ2824631.1 hypothetical protein IWW50_003243 [Coemansia erecta]
MEPGTHWDNSTAAAADGSWHKRQTHITQLRRQPGEKDASLMAARVFQTTTQSTQIDCCIVPKPVRSALEFVTDMAQLAMPSLFMADMEDNCPITRTLCHGISGPLRLGCEGVAAIATDTTTHSHKTTARHNAAAQTGDEEPGNVFGLDAPASCVCACACCTSHCCFSSSAATMRNWKCSVLQAKNAGLVCRLSNTSPLRIPAVSRSLVEETMRLAGASVDTEDLARQPAEPLRPASGANDALLPTAVAWPAVEPPAYSAHRYQQLSQDIESDSNATKTPSASESSNSSTADDAAALDRALMSTDKLLLVNQYLLRRIRKLELTNQIIKEAYAEVNEILDSERQYNVTQLKALKRKHDEDLELLAETYNERARMERSSSVQSFISQDSADEDDLDYAFKPGFSTTRKGASASCTSSPLMGGSAGYKSSPPPNIQRSISDTAFSSISNSMGTVVPCELSVEFLQPVSEGGPNEESDWESGGGPKVVFESAAWDTDDEDEDEDEVDESDASAFSEDSDDDGEVEMEFTAELARKMRDADITASYSSGSESDSEFDSDYASDTESESDFADHEKSSFDESSSHVHTSGVHISTNDYASVDPVRAVISRYYPQSGRLCISADIDDVIPDTFGELTQRAHGDDCSTAEPFSYRRNADDSDGAADAQDGISISPARLEKTMEELEMEHNALLPADQRLAKFIHRASSHLQQGARGGLTLGFMMHNLEVQAEKFASNHASVLCAFVESLYQLAESMNGQTSADAANQPRSALSKKQRDEACSPQQAVMRIVRLLHTFIAAPEDQLLILQQLEALTEANSQIRPLRHALLLRILYESELVDRGTIIRWYSSLPGAEESDGERVPADAANADASKITRGKLLRENASPLIIELATESPAGKEGTASAPITAMEKLHHAILTTEGCGSASVGSNTTSMSTPCLPGLPAVGGTGTGTLTPVSEESLAVRSLSSGHEAGSGKAGSRGLVTTSTSYVSVLCRTGSALSMDHEGFAQQLCLERAAGSLAVSVAGSDSSSSHQAAAANVRPPKQVTFAAN